MLGEIKICYSCLFYGMQRMTGAIHIFKNPLLFSTFQNCPTELNAAMSQILEVCNALIFMFSFK